ncbi:hypothetical protein CERSUDRAFT_96684 [Gelatoporia subvermispora B]|uniref:F-box domain-containing protein n=1 Tax=Ceriporiopsis subvermispora (strain B) TaxID=914234 RepID=M2QET8_CERS8|nr:hypothetical protein CERSUDRAFT_96684 [Gelatoporia subvermispora B]
MLPVLYTTVTLPTYAQIVDFASTLHLSTISVELGETQGPALASLVRHIWMGPTSTTPQDALSCGSLSWPVTLIHQIFDLCTSLHALALVNLAHAYWNRLQAKVPASVEQLTVGPIHGPIVLRTMRCAENLRTITSFDTFLPDWEVREIVVAPTIHRFRRFFSTSSVSRISFAFDQLPCLRDATSLREMQIVCAEEDQRVAEENLKILSDEFKDFIEDPRVKLVALSHKYKSNGNPDGFRLLYERWDIEIALHVT